MTEDQFFRYLSMTKGREKRRVIHEELGGKEEAYGSPGRLFRNLEQPSHPVGLRYANCDYGYSGKGAMPSLRA